MADSIFLADYLASVRSNVDRSISMYNNESTRLLIQVTSDKNELLVCVCVFVWFGWYLKLSLTIIVLVHNAALRETKEQRCC